MSKVVLFNNKYTYCHENMRGFHEIIDVHEIIIARSRGRNWFLFFCILLLLLHASHLLLVKEKIGVYVFGTVLLSVLIARLWRSKEVRKEAVVIMPAFGVQLETHYLSGRVTRRFVSIGKILKPVLNEIVTPVTCYWSLALILRGEDKLTLVFQSSHFSRNQNPQLECLFLFGRHCPLLQMGKDHRKVVCKVMLGSSVPSNQNCDCLALFKLSLGQPCP